MNKGLMKTEIIEDLEFLENTKIEGSRNVIKLSLSSQKPSARSTYFKIVYDRIRNKSMFRYDELLFLIKPIMCIENMLKLKLMRKRRKMNLRLICSCLIRTKAKLKIY